MDSWCQHSNKLGGRAVVFVPHSRDHAHPRMSRSRLQKWAAKPEAKQQLRPGVILNPAQPKGIVSSLRTREWALQLLFQPHFPKQPLGRVLLLYWFSSTDLFFLCRMFIYTFVWHPPFLSLFTSLVIYPLLIACLFLYWLLLSRTFEL